MKVVAVLGSMRGDGSYSSTLAREVLRGAEAAGHEVVVYELKDMDLRGCYGCEACKKNNIDCVLQDDLKPYWKDLHEAGALVVSAPNFCSQVCGPMITYMNRHYCLISGEGKVRVHPGIKLVGVFSQGYEDGEAYKQAYAWYLDDFCNRDMVLVDTLIYTNSEALTAEHPLMQRAFEVGMSL